MGAKSQRGKIPGDKIEEYQQMIESINAVTLITGDMPRAVAFYTVLGFELKYGGPDASFTSFHAGTGFLNLTRAAPGCMVAFWGRAIFHVDDVDAQYARAVAGGLTPAFAPRDAAWGERYFHIVDPDGHEISFARPLPPRPQA
jgi:catechol 2,3-dioxygenase-like lactoylglutathione lyase family enzyme